MKFYVPNLSMLEIRFNCEFFKPSLYTTKNFLVKPGESSHETLSNEAASSHVDCLTRVPADLMLTIVFRPFHLVYFCREEAW